MGEKIGIRARIGSHNFYYYKIYIFFIIRYQKLNIEEIKFTILVFLTCSFQDRIILKFIFKKELVWKAYNAMGINILISIECNTNKYNVLGIPVSRYWGLLYKAIPTYKPSPHQIQACTDIAPAVFTSTTSLIIECLPNHVMFSLIISLLFILLLN